MNIGILAYNAACNFGANLQLLSTVRYIMNNGHQPFVINWVPLSLENHYKNKISSTQYAVHLSFRKKFYNETSICRTAKDVADVISKYNINGVIIGSDAIAQHHPFLSRIVFPSRRIISFPSYSEDRMFPNVFWGLFNDFLKKPVPIAILSASSQNSNYRLFSSAVNKKMREYVMKYCYISVRDSWTQKMYNHITHGEITPTITPDPVFAFNHNVSNLPTKQDILSQFDLKDKYIILSFFNNNKVSISWLDEFQKKANREGYQCVAMAFPEGVRFKHNIEKEISIPLSPIDWYSLIKYASGYVGHNMHPIVVSLHNATPFFSFDNYGISKFRFFVNEKSSKIYDLLAIAGFLNNRTCDESLFNRCPSVDEVLSTLFEFDSVHCKKFADEYYRKYLLMMDDIMNKLTAIG